MANTETIKLKIDTEDFKEIIAEFKDMLDRREAKIIDLETRIEAIEQCPVVFAELG